MEKTIKIYEGLVKWNIYGRWSDVDTGLFVDSTDTESMLREYEGQNVRVTIEVIPFKCDDDGSDDDSA